MNGFYMSGVTTVKDADTWISNTTEKNRMPVCIICASTSDTLTVEVSDDAGATWTEIADLASQSGDTVMDWMFYVTKTGSTLIKTTGTGFLRVQGHIEAA